MAASTTTTTQTATIAVSDGMAYYLTGCCKASAKGSFVGDEPATVCRSCYHEIPAWMGDAALITDAEGLQRLAERLQG